MSKQEIYSAECPSERFTRFIASLGNLINVKEACNSFYIGGLPRDGAEGIYGLVWRNELTQVFFHVNTLMRIKDKGNEMAQVKEEDYIRVKNRISNDNVVVVWNESGKELPDEVIKDSNTGIYILIDPLPNSFCIVKVLNLFDIRKGKGVLLEEKVYGSIPGYTVINDSYLPKIILRSVIVADIKSQIAAKGKEKGLFVSELLKRCSVIKEIKRKAWLQGKKVDRPKP